MKNDDNPQTGFPTRRVLWTADPLGAVFRAQRGKMTRPNLLLTAAPARELVEWLTANVWARDLPICLWHPEDGPHIARSLAGAAHGGWAAMDVAQFQEAGDGVWCVAGARELVGGAARAVGPSPSLNRIDACIDSATDVAVAFGARGTPPVAWEIGAHHTGGLLAIGARAAERHAKAVAVSPYDPSALFPMAAHARGLTPRVVLEREVQATALKL